MKKLLVIATLLAIAGSVLASTSIKWGHDYEAAEKLAAKSHKLLMVDMYTDSCIWCRRLDAYVYPSQPVLKESQNFVALKLNAENEGRTAATLYGVNVYPTVLFLKPNGDLVYKIMGFMPPARFAKEMRKALRAGKSGS